LVCRRAAAASGLTLAPAAAAAAEDAEDAEEWEWAGGFNDL